MQHVLLGFALGLASIITPGPIGLTLVGLASRRGTSAGLAGAAGVAGGDLTGATIAVGIVALSASLPATLFSVGQLLAALVLIGFGVALLGAPSAIDHATDKIHRPARALFALTTFAPHALIGWMAMFAAMPFAADVRSLATFALGAAAASALWHPALAIASARLGGNVTDRTRQRATRVGGALMIGFGVVATVALVG